MKEKVLSRLDKIAASIDIPGLIDAVGNQVRPQWNTVFPEERARRISRLVISACGDSLFAGIACRLAIERLTRLPCEPMDALECAHYASASFGAQVAALAISNSGTTSRVLESAELARQTGALTLALSGAGDAPLTRLAEGAVIRTVGERQQREGPTARVERHLLEYVATLVSLYHMAFHLAVVRGVLSPIEVQAEVEALRAAGEEAQVALAASAEHVARVLPHLRDADRIFYLGAGPAYGTALFGAAKLLEEVPLCGIPQALEEWAHEQYFLTMVEGPRTRAVMIAPPGESTARAAEVLDSIRADGGIAIAVTHPSERAISDAATAVIAVGGHCPERYSPVPYAVSMQVLGLALALDHGHTTIPLARADGGRLIRGSGAKTPR